VALLAGLLACRGATRAASPEPAPPPSTRMQPVTVVTTHDQIAALDGQTVTVHGTYTQVEARRRHPRDTRPPDLQGHVALVLDDGRKVFLEPIWSPDALRPDDERARLTGQPVAVTGTLHATMPEPEVPVATLTAACLTPVTAVEAR